MEAFPHHYQVSVAGKPEDSLQTSADHLPTLQVSPPTQFGGPGDQWSPEDLLMASIANCLVLSFRAVAKAGRFEWLSIDCASEGILDRVERKIKFTHVTNKVTLTIASEDSREKAEKLLHKAEASCLISNSLSCETHLDIDILIEGE